MHRQRETHPVDKVGYRFVRRGSVSGLHRRRRRSICRRGNDCGVGEPRQDREKDERELHGVSKDRVDD